MPRFNETEERKPADTKNMILTSKFIKTISNKKNLFDNTLENKILDIISKITKSFCSKIKSRYGFSIILDSDFAVQKFCTYLKEIDPKFDKRQINNDRFEDCLFGLLIDENTVMIVKAGNPFISSADKYAYDIYRGNNTFNKVTVSIYGKYAKKHIEEIKKLTTFTSLEQLVIYNINGSDDEKETNFQSIISDLNPRDIDTLFYNGNTKEQIIKHIDSFFNNRSIYQSRNISYKTGILLYGDPGTGKSSIVSALACKYNLNIVLINMNTFVGLDTAMLKTCIEADDLTYIVLLEDIDTIFNISREDGKEVDKDDRKVINKLLQFLDSNSSPSNVIFIATTNYIDRLDSALLRSGRFDLKINIGPINKEEAIGMCKSFNCTEAQIDNIMSNYSDNDMINQSSLQGLILDEFKKEIINNEEN